MMLPNYRVLDARIDRLPTDELRAMQAERLRNQVRHVYERTEFWRRKFDAVGLRPEDVRGLQDLGLIPFCTKQELQEDQAQNPPFGSYTASHPTSWVRYVSTSGTTGRPVRRVFSARDWGYIMDRFQRIGSTRPGDILIQLGPIDGLMGPTASVESFARQGGLAVCAGLYDTKTKAKLIGELRPTVVAGTTSYLLHLAEVAEEMGLHFPTLKIGSISAVGEPGAAIRETRERLLKAWGVSHVADGYGNTEIFPLGGNCLCSSNLHVHDDMVITEVIDPETGELLGPGRPGELVFTNLVGDTQPLLRYRSRDIGVLAGEERCECGMTVTRIAGIQGRVDDMIWYRGANLFPSAIEAAVRKLPELGHEFQIVIESKGSMPALTVRAEVASGVGTDHFAELTSRLEQELKEAIRVSAQVELIPFGTIPRTEGKARRIVDLRKR